MEFRTDDRVEVLYPGDSLYFESEMNHSFRGSRRQAGAVDWSSSGANPNRLVTGGAFLRFALCSSNCFMRL